MVGWISNWMKHDEICGDKMRQSDASTQIDIFFSFGRQEQTWVFVAFFLEFPLLKIYKMNVLPPAIYEFYGYNWLYAFQLYHGFLVGRSTEDQDELEREERRKRGLYGLSNSEKAPGRCVRKLIRWMFAMMLEAKFATFE